MKQNDQVHEIFVASCLEQLTNIETSILDLELKEGQTKEDAVGTVFRAAHSIKGDAASMGLENISTLSHALENVLQVVRDCDHAIPTPIIDLLLSGFDLLHSMLLQPDLGDTQDITEMLANLEAISIHGVACTPLPELAGTQFATTTPSTAPQTGNGAHMEILHTNETVDSTITRLSIAAEQLDTLVDRVGQLSIAQTRLNKLATQEENKETLPLVEEIEALCTQLRNQVLTMRMLPIQVSFAKYRRLVRDACTQLGKLAHFTMKGESTELDKKLIEELNFPLIHLLRNAVTHGIETPAQREKAGKPARGNIQLSAQQVGSEVLLKITDDGAGIDIKKLQQRALDLNYIPVEEHFSDKDLVDLVFLPGLSTQDNINEIAGRGVGMDAVLKSVQAMRGKVEIESDPGQGTCISIQLPITMAIIDCLMIGLAETEYYIHLEYIEECLEFKLTDAQRKSGITRIKLHDKMLPLIDLHTYFETNYPRSEQAYIVVVRTNQGRFGLVVDEVLGQSQAVLKQLGPALSNVQGLLGATVTELGNMGLILDIPGLAKAVLKDYQNQRVLSRVKDRIAT